MVRTIRAAGLGCAAVLICALPARAASIGSIGPNCGTCQGSIYTLSIEQAGQDLNPLDGNLYDTYVVKLSIDTSGYTGGGVRIDDVAVKISSGVDTAKLTSMTITDGGTNYANYWKQVSGGISANGCSGSGSGYDCVDWIAGSAIAASVPTSTILTWTFLIDVKGPVFGLPGSDPSILPSIKVRYVDSSGNKVGALVSENVPEPCTLALLGMGGLVAAVRRRRSRG